MTQTKVEAPFVENNRPFRNIIINGDMAVNQRGDTTGITSSGYYVCDRWNQNMSDAGTFSISQDTDVPAGYGFSKSLKLDCTTADASVAAGSVHRIYQRIEAQYLAPVHSGSANAKQLVYSFWIKFDNVSGDFCANILNLSDSNNRVIAKKFTYGSGAGWQKYSFVIPGDTGGNALTPDNSGAYYVQIYMQAGSNFTSGTLSTSWATRTDANRAVGQTLQLASNTSNNVYFTGAQLEIGDAPSDFEHLPYDINLLRCQRYFQKWQADQTYDQMGEGAAWSDTAFIWSYRLCPRMRDQPSATVTGNLAGAMVGNDRALSSIQINRTTVDVCQFTSAISDNNETGTPGFCRDNNDGDAKIEFDAEL